MPTIEGQPTYGTVDKSKSKKDLFVLDKNSGTYGTPVYTIGDTRNATSEEVQQILNTPIIKKVSLSSAQLQAGATTPYQLIAAPGAGFAIQVICASVRFNYVSATYVGAVGFIYIYTDTALTILFQTGGSLLKRTSSSFEPFQPLAGAPASAQIIENKAIYANQANDLTVGDGTADIYITYQIIEL